MHFTVLYLSLSATALVMTVSYAKPANLCTLVSSFRFEEDSLGWYQGQRHSVKCDVIRKESIALVSVKVVLLFILGLYSDGGFPLTSTVPF